MFKASFVRFFAVIIAVLCIGACVSADVQLKGLKPERIVFDKDTFDYQIDYRPTYAFYNTTNRYQVQYYTLHVGGCKVEFRAMYCGYSQTVYRHHQIQFYLIGSNIWEEFHSIYPSFTANSSSVIFPHDGHNLYIPCNVQFDSSSVPGRYIIDVSLSGEVSPDLVVNFVGAELFDTSMLPTTTIQEPTTVSSTQASLSSLSTSTPVDISTTLKPPCPQCEERGLESWLIALIAAIIFLALLAIGLCVGVFCCYRRMQKAKTQKVVKNEHTTAGSTMGTVSTAPGTLVKETNLYGPDMMYFGRGATPLDPNAKSEATNLATQINPALSMNPMQAAK